jgi:hypothetical protein
MGKGLKKEISVFTEVHTEYTAASNKKGNDFKTGM